MASESVSNDSMRILRVAQTLYPDVKGGGAYHVHAMSRDQAEMGHDVTVLTVRNDPKLPHLEERDGYTVVRYDPTTSLLGNDISIGLAQYLQEAEDFDVIHAHSHLYFSTNLAALKRQLGSIPLAITNHGLYSQTAPKWVFDCYLRTVGRWTFNQADVVFCYTDVDEERLREFGVSSKVSVVSNGVDTARFTPDGPESELISSDGPVVLFVGRLVAGKRPRDALKTVEIVRDEYPNVRLYFCGEGPLRDELEEYVTNEQLEDTVRFLGHVSYDEMPKLYRSANVLVLPSQAEGLPRTVLEAMATSVPVVCSDLDQVVSIIDGAGTTVPVGDVDQFASEIARYLDDRTHTKERTSIEEQFSWRETADRTTAVLEALSN